MRIDTRIACMKPDCRAPLALVKVSGPSSKYECKECGEVQYEVAGIDGINRWSLGSDPLNELPAERPGYQQSDYSFNSWVHGKVPS